MDKVLNFPMTEVPVFISMLMRNEDDKITVCGYQNEMGVIVEKYFRPTGQDINELYRQGLGIVFLGDTTEIFDPPQPTDKLTCSMWLSGVDGPVLRFELRVNYEDGRTAYVSVVFMVVFDTRRRHIVRDPENYLNFKYFNKGEKIIEASSRSNIELEGMREAGIFRIRPSMIDASGHVHNLRYMEFAYDVLPQEYRCHMDSFRRSEIFFHHEMREGEDIHMKIKEGGKRVSVAGFKTDGKPAFSAAMYFDLQNGSDLG